MKTTATSILAIIFGLLLFFVETGVAQNGDDDQDKQNDETFDDDPFFQRPLEELLRQEEYERMVRETDSLLVSKRRIDFPERDMGGPSEYPGISDLYPTLPLAIRYNRVDGLFMGIRTKPMEWDRGDRHLMKMYGSLGYGFRSNYWQYSIGVERFFGFNQNVKLGILYRNMLATEDMWRTAPIENSLSAFFAGYDFLDYYETEGVQPYAVFRTGSFFEHTLAFKAEDHRSIERNTRYSLFGQNRHLNPMVTEGHLQAFKWSTGFHSGGFVLGGRVALSGDIQAEIADLGWLNSDFGFNRYEMELRSDFQIDPSAILRTRFRGGTSVGELPFQRQFALGGIGTLRGRSHKEFIGSDMLLLNAELHLGDHIRRTEPRTEGFNVDWGEFLAYLIFDVGWVNQFEFEQENFLDGFNNFDSGDIKTDIGIGMSLPLSRVNALRFELAWPTDDFEAGPALWIRFNPTF